LRARNIRLETELRAKASNDSRLHLELKALRAPMRGTYGHTDLCSYST
jgi:hypothetical protein